MNTKTKTTLLSRVIDFLENKIDAAAALKDINKHVQEDFINTGDAIPNNLAEKIRCVIYREKQGKIKRVAKGVYISAGKDSTGLIIHGSGRDLSEIEDESIDLQVADHPWEDKKAHTSGNQKNFSASYEESTFRYTQEDFIQKARVLKQGGYLIEFLPVESFSNTHYLREIREMAEAAGLKFYCKSSWHKAKEGAINNGRTTKGVEDILVYYKPDKKNGNRPRRLAPKGKPYFTSKIVPGRIEIPAPSPKEKTHQAEKSKGVFRLLYELFSKAGDTILDAFSGSLNSVEIAIEMGRFPIAYELCDNIMQKAVDRLGLVQLYSNVPQTLDEPSVSNEYQDKANSEIAEINFGEQMMLAF